MLRTTLRVLLAIAVLAAGPLAAEPMNEQAMKEAMRKNITLTPALVERTLDAMEDMADQGLMKQQPDRSRAESKAKMTAIADEHGFGDVTELVVALNSTMRAYGSLRMQEEVGQAEMDKAEAQYEEQRAQIENDPNMPEQRKQQMLRMLDSQRQVMKAMADNKNTQVIRPYRGRLEGILDQAGLKR